MSAEARERILARVRAGVAGAGDDATRRAGVADRLMRHPRGTIPSRSEGAGPARRALFARMVEAAGATVTRVATGDEIPEEIADYLRANNLPGEIRTGAAPFLAALPWQRATTLTRTEGPAEPGDSAGLSVAYAAVAETGTLVLVSGPDNPTSLNFLPETHIVIVAASCLHRAYEDAWDGLRAVYGAGHMPRAVNLVTGPSRTADIEQTLLMGAHGPKRLHVILVDEA